MKIQETFEIIIKKRKKKKTHKLIHFVRKKKIVFKTFQNKKRIKQIEIYYLYVISFLFLFFVEIK